MNIQGFPLSNIDINGTAAKPADKPGEFGQMLKDAVSQIDQAQTEAQSKIGEVMKGNGSDLHSAMIAVEKADLSFQMMLQVRNKIVAAYQEISHMSF
jgi:flagellar hook-basal body complex protein FliE